MIKIKNILLFAQRRGPKGLLVLLISKVWRLIGRRCYWRNNLIAKIVVYIVTCIVGVAQFVVRKKVPVVRLLSYTELQIDAFNKAFPLNYSSIIEVCDQLVNNKLYLAAVGELDLTADTVWTCDLISKRHYPKIMAEHYYSELIANEGDPRLLWELNRLQFLVTLAQGYVLTKNEGYLDAAVRIIDSWVNGNIQNCGVNWSDAQEVGIRMTSLILAKLLFESSGVHINSMTPVEQIIADHSNYILFNLSLNRATHNHLLTELASLLVYAHTGPADDPLLYIKKAFSIWMLRYEVQKQLDEDGMGKEQSTNYTLFVYDAIILANYIYRRGYGNNILDSSTFSRMRSVILNLSIGDSDFVKLGDADCGRHSRLSWRSDLSRIGFVPVIDEICLNGKDKTRGNSEELFWLDPAICLNARASDTVKVHSAGPDLYRSSGLLIFRANARQLFIRLGPTGIDPDVRFGHAHSDYLSFSLYIDDEPVFVDPGTYTYLGPDSKRTYLRSAKMHNTITLDEMEFLDVKARIFGIPDLHPVAIGELIHDDGIYSISASFEYSKEEVISRRFFFDKDLEFIVIINSAKSNIPRRMCENYVISQDIETVDNGRYSLKLPNENSVTLSIINDADNELLISRYEMSYAPRYGSAQKGLLLERKTKSAQNLVKTAAIIQLGKNPRDASDILPELADVLVNELD